ncbi:MAG: hypothetical protein CO119_02465 [Flavobacteriales bacterium CG_4_9_14_3_um_filter_40_17]|nr:MAG: hypothetical protein CO119_02465 [Flavobacteriales bacterium CG_4_9_14_3_um_filter_40_17]
MFFVNFFCSIFFEFIIDSTMYGLFQNIFGKYLYLLVCFFVKVKIHKIIPARSFNRVFFLKMRRMFLFIVLHIEL